MWPYLDIHVKICMSTPHVVRVSWVTSLCIKVVTIVITFLYIAFKEGRELLVTCFIAYRE